MEKLIISRFFKKPKNKIAWKGMWLGLSTLLIPPALGIFASLSRYITDPVSMEGREGFNMLGAGMGVGVVLISLILAYFALRSCLRAYIQGERSWVMWVGFVPSVLIILFWIFMIGGEIFIPH